MPAGPAPESPTHIRLNTPDTRMGLAFPMTFDSISPSAEIRLVAVDMDGTLLDADKQLPDEVWPLLRRLRERGIVFVPASGRQYATLHEMFGDGPRGIIAENGTLVSLDGSVRSTTPLPVDRAREAVAQARELQHSGMHIGQVVCGVRSAYIESQEPEFVRETSRYYRALETVPDLLAPELIGEADEILKIAIYDFAGAETHSAPVMRRFEPDVSVVVSGENWLDIVPANADKGRALRALQGELDVTAAQTAAFGDYLNDLELLDAADWSFAMANAHPLVLERARYRAPSNADHGVLRVLEQWLDATE